MRRGASSAGPSGEDRLKRTDEILFHGGAPDKESKQEFFDLYRMMVESSEALVARRQGVNTFFLTINGLLLTGIGLVLRGEGELRLKALGIGFLFLTGFVLAWTWRSLLISFGQLNTGKFAVITRMEDHLAASIYRAEWQALGEGKDRAIYKSFTDREKWVPTVLLAVYLVAAVVCGLVWLDQLHLTSAG